MPADWILVLRLLLAAGLAGTVGLERELTDQPAGFRTHILVGVGACLFAILSAFGFQAIAGTGPTSVVRADLTRIASQIVVGIGFIGGGVIFKSGPTIRGLTTAATLWVTAAIGTAVAVGAVAIAVVTTGVTMLALVALRPLRTLVRRHAPDQEEFMVQGGTQLGLDELVRGLAPFEAHIQHISVAAENGSKTFRLHVRMSSDVRPPDVAAKLARVPDVTNVEWAGG